MRGKFVDGLIVETGAFDQPLQKNLLPQPFERRAADKLHPAQVKRARRQSTQAATSLPFARQSGRPDVPFNNS